MPPDPSANVTAPASLTKTQLEDLATLLATRLPRGGIEWLAEAVLGRSAVLDAGDAIHDLHALAKETATALNSAGRIPDAVAHLRREGHLNTRLLFELNHILHGGRLDDSEALQAFTNEYEPFLSAVEFKDYFPKLLRTVCAIGLAADVKKIVGSGFLVGPDLVMTNYHVLEQFLLFDSGKKTITEKQPGSDVYCFFDYLCAPPPAVPPVDSRSASVYVQAVDAGWLIFAREKLAKDGTEECCETVKTEFDYAVIKLRKPIGTLADRPGGGTIRGWLSLSDDIGVLEKGRRVLVFQHPETEPQQFDIGDLYRLDPSSTRLWYSVSTAKGSSGGAAIDQQGKLIALHNAEVKREFPGLPPLRKMNQGVRIDYIAKDIKAANVLPANWNDPPGAEELKMSFWSLNDDPGDPRPIIGRKNFRDAVRQMSAADGQRVLVVSGKLRSGLHYSVKLLRRLVPTHNPIVTFSRKDIEQLSPKQFLKVLAQEVGALDVSDMPDPLATEAVSRWLRVRLSEWLSKKLAADAAAEPARYPAWVVINTVVADDDRLLWADNLRELVAALTGVRDQGQTAIDVPQLRWVFLSTKPETVTAPVTRIDEALSMADFETEFAECLQVAWRSIVNKNSPGHDPALLKGMASVVEETNADQLPLRKALANSVRKIVLNAK